MIFARVTFSDHDSGIVAVLRLIAELGLPLASIEDEVAERSRYVALYGVVVQVKVEDILQVTANRFSAYEDPAWRYSDGVLGERCSHGIDVFAIVGVGKILLQVGILILDNRLSGSTNAPTINQRMRQVRSYAPSVSPSSRRWFRTTRPVCTCRRR